MSKTGLENSTITRTAARNAAESSSCTRAGILPFPGDIGSTDQSMTLVRCQNQDGETPIEEDKRFWRKMADLADTHFPDFTKSFGDHAQNVAVLSSQNTLFTETFDLGQGGGLFGLGIHLPVTQATQTLVPGRDYWQFDKDHWAQGHDKIICAELTSEHIAMLPNVYPSGCSPDGSVPPEPTGGPYIPPTSGPGGEGEEGPGDGGGEEGTPEPVAEEDPSIFDECWDTLAVDVIGVANEYEQADDDPALIQNEETYGDYTPPTPNEGPTVSSGAECDLYNLDESWQEGSGTWGSDTNNVTLGAGVGNVDANVGINAELDWTNGEFTVGGDANVNVSVGEVFGEANGEWLDGAITGTAEGTIEVVQAGADIGGEATLDLHNGEVVLSGNAGAEINIIKAEGSIEGTVTIGGVPITLTAEGGASIGAGAQASGTFAINSEGITIGGKLGAALGLGLEGGVSITIGWPSWW